MHGKFVHPKTYGLLSRGHPAREDVRGEVRVAGRPGPARVRGAISIFYNAGPPTPNAEPLLGKMPWLEDRPVSFSCTGFLPPNCTLFGRIDCVRLMIAWPDGPHRSRTIIYHLFPEEFFARPGFTETLKVYRDYQLQ